MVAVFDVSRMYGKHSVADAELRRQHVKVGNGFPFMALGKVYVSIEPTLQALLARMIVNRENGRKLIISGRSFYTIVGSYPVLPCLRKHDVSVKPVIECVQHNADVLQMAVVVGNAWRKDVGFKRFPLVAQLAGDIERIVELNG